MSKFFTTPSDLINWVKTQNQSAEEAADKIQTVLASGDHEQDIAESAQRIFAGRNAEHAGDVLFEILSSYDITEDAVKEASAKISKIYASNELLKNKLITAEQHEQLVKTAQIMRQPGQYQMELRVCPKLPASVGNRRISTYNCVHYCLDSLCVDDDPNRVICMEAMWRKHVADKFSRDFKDTKTGQLIGGYIGNRFFTFPTAGTPANPDAPRDGGNPMSLKPGERSRQARPHEYSMERRLQEAREKGSTESIVLADGFHAAMTKQAEAVGMTKLASSNILPSQEKISKIFSEAVDLHNAGIPAEDAAVKIAKSNPEFKVENIIRIQEIAVRKMAKHNADVYSMIKQAQPVLPSAPASLEQTQHRQPILTEGMLIDVNGQRIPHGTPLVPQGSTPDTTQFLNQSTGQVVTLSRQDAADLLAMVQDASMLIDGKTPEKPAVTAPSNSVPASQPTEVVGGQNEATTPNY